MVTQMGDLVNSRSAAVDTLGRDGRGHGKDKVWCEAGDGTKQQDVVGREKGSGSKGGLYSVCGTGAARRAGLKRRRGGKDGERPTHQKGYRIRPEPHLCLLSQPPATWETSTERSGHNPATW